MKEIFSWNQSKNLFQREWRLLKNMQQHIANGIQAHVYNRLCVGEKPLPALEKLHLIKFYEKHLKNNPFNNSKNPKLVSPISFYYTSRKLGEKYIKKKKKRPAW